MRTIALVCVTTAMTIQAASAALPRRESACDTTQIAAMEHRLQDAPGRFTPGSGTAVKLADGGYVVSYDEMDAVAGWRRGDPAVICLMRIPRDCPPGDARGRYYTVTNLRVMSSVTLSDSEHGCGGA